MYIKLSALLALLLLLISRTHSFTFAMGNYSIIPAAIHNSLSLYMGENHKDAGRQQTYNMRLKMLMFPYNIYEYRSKRNLNQFSNNYLFLKLNYSSDVAQIFNNSERIYDDVDQYKKLYQSLPSAAIFKSEQTQYLDLIIIDQPLLKRIFAIKNMTNYYSNIKKDRFFDIQIFKLDIHSFIRLIIRQSSKQLNIFSLDFNAFLRKDSIKYTQLMGNQTTKNHFILINYIGNENNFNNNTQNSNFLFSSQFKQRIHQSTKLSLKSNSLDIYFAYANIKKDDHFITNLYEAESKNILGSNNSINNQQKQKISLQIHLLVFNLKKLKTINYLSQPLSNLNLNTLNHFQLTFYQKYIKLFLSDNTHYYIIDVSEPNWHFDIFRDLKQNKINIITGHSYDVIAVQNNQIAYIQNYKNLSLFNIMIGKQLQVQFIWSKDISSQRFILCLSDKNCSLYQKKFMKQALKINLTIDVLNKSKIQQSIQLQNDKLTLFIIVVDQKTLNQTFKYPLQTIMMTINHQNQTKSLLSTQIYNFDVYRDIKILKQQQMNKMIYEYFDKIGNRIFAKANYIEFLQYISHSDQKIAQNESCYTISQPNSNTETFDFNNNKWSVCSFNYSSNSFIELNIKYTTLQTYDTYICHDGVDNFTIANVQCELHKFKAQNKELKEFIDLIYLKRGKLYKFYIFKDNKYTKKSPIFQFKDIQREFYQLGQTIFYLFLVGLSFSLLFLICFIIWKPIIRTLFLYFGITNQAVEPKYPLNWINLKIKIKRLQKMDYLKYIEFDVTQGETQQHDCCFCLQSLKKGSKVAELYCLHTFHADCFNEWIRNQPNNRCPKCRRQFTQSQLLQFQNNMQIGQQMV